MTPHPRTRAALGALLVLCLWFAPLPAEAQQPSEADLAKINQQRGEWIERFNREIKL